MKLAQGEYVALEVIENTYSKCPIVEQLYVHGESLQSYLVGVVIPDPVQLCALALDVTGATVSPKDPNALEALIRDPKIQGAVLQLLTTEAKNSGLSGLDKTHPSYIYADIGDRFETVKRIHLSSDRFTVDNGTMTPTFKIRRKDAYNMFKKELHELYARGEQR
jgi:long-chain acyl-CoA synthetase